MHRLDSNINDCNLARTYREGEKLSALRVLSFQHHAVAARPRSARVRVRVMGLTKPVFKVATMIAVIALEKKLRRELQRAGLPQP